METVSFKLQEDILKKIDSLLKSLNFNNRTEFIRDSIRQRLNQIEIERDPFLKAVAKFKGSAKVHVSDERLEKIKEEVGREFAKKYGLELD